MKLSQLNLIFTMSLNIHNPYAIVVQFLIRKCTVLLLFIILAPSLYAQDFTVTAVPTNEVCDGTGTITLSTENTTPGAVVNYIVSYLGPNGTSTPVVVHNSINTTVPNQQDGVYSIQATQYTNSSLSTPIGAPATTSATIGNDYEPVVFSLSSKPILCGNDGSITVEVTSGTPLTYTISPATGTPLPQPQTSNTFTGLSHNTVYTVVVTDVCGEGNPQSLTIFEAIPQLQISMAMFPDIELPACDKLTIKNDVISTNGVPITYPLQAKFTVTHFDGTINVYDVSIDAGLPLSGSASTIIDYHYDEPCSYKVEVTDTCGNTIESPTLLINPLLSINGETLITKCNGRNIKYTPAKYVGPFTLEFVNPPAGFNPADFNSQYPGPYTIADVPILFGDEDNQLPIGDYQVIVHDACNRTPDAISSIVTIEIPEVEITAIPYAATCQGDGRVEAFIPGLPIGEALITSGPNEYSTVYDVDVSAGIINQQPGGNREKVWVYDLPPGEYTIFLRDTCGTPYPPAIFTIKPYQGDKASILARPDCEEGYGTIQVSGSGFTHIEIIAAPTAFSDEFPLPYNATSHINSLDSYLYMDHMPPGQYKFKAANDCDDDIEMPPGFATIPAYKITTDEYELIPHCGSFDLFFNHVSTGTAFVSFSLQKWDPVAEMWSHPNTGTLYIDGDPIVNNGGDVLEHNGLKLINNTINYNLIYPTGTYRIVKQYTTFGDGADGEKQKLCTQTLYEFEYYSELEITGAVNLDCMGNSGNIQIIVFGVPPFEYSVVSPFYMDNGQSNVFTGLDSGSYVIRVTDDCGYIRERTINIADLPSLISVPEPEELTAMAVCDEGGDGEETFDISPYTPIILDDQDPTEVTITYYFTLAEAEQGTNQIPDPTNVTTGTTTIYARATHSINADCVAITWFELVVNPIPVLNMKDKWGGCEGEDVIIIADSGFSSYSWTTPSGIILNGPSEISASDEGIYTVTVKDNIGCETTKSLEVVKSPVPHISTVTIEDWTDQDNVLTVVMEPNSLAGNYLYSLDNINYQSSPVFGGLTPGQYTVYVKDEFGCGDDQFDTYILTYPKFFTPNGDSVNEYWRIYLAALEPDMLVYIYDRYGKLITGFDAKSKGWDGTLDGKRLPATDYWFVVKRQNGQELKGHFSMLR